MNARTTDAVEGDSDVETLRRVGERTVSFVYGNVLSLVGVSVAWFLASLPLVTIGPATVGAYAAIDSLRETGRIDRGAVAHAVRTNGLHAALLSALPVVLGAVGATYAYEYTTTGGALVGVLAVVTIYATAYAILVLIPAFVALSRGADPIAALRRGWRWTVAHPTLALTTGLLTLLVLVGMLVLTVGFVCCFPAVAFSFHVELFSAREPNADEPTTIPFRMTAEL